MPYKDPEKRKQYGKKHYALTKERYKETQNIWRKNNPEKVREQKRRYRSKHRDHIRAYQLIWEHRNPEKKHGYQWKYRVENRQLINDKELFRKEVKRFKTKIGLVTEDCTEETIINTFVNYMASGIYERMVDSNGRNEVRSRKAKVESPALEGNRTGCSSTHSWEQEVRRLQLAEGS